ncbi:integrase domain-containing protein [Marinobacterium rhizophilum]|uniref:integrase domain-containing protein n=1 Tax=Marinobacterium rhizophilum TaxID=420402 RepID=UPI00036A7A7A|nr:integrase domain-containing protein [Marinobacterium rhizophilum]
MVQDFRADSDYRRFQHSVRRRNFGYGKQLSFAAYICLLWLYGHGHYLTRHTHHVRFRQFTRFLRSEFDIRDARKIRLEHVSAYAQSLADLVDQGRMRVSYAQNLLSTVNVVLSGFRRDKKLIIEPAAAVGRRRHVRTTLPGGDWSEVEEAVEIAEQMGYARGAAIILLARAFGLRYREAVLANLPRLVQEAAKHSFVTILDGTKGGRRSPERRIHVGPRQNHALVCALSVCPHGSNNLLQYDETFRQFLNREAKPIRAVLKGAGIRCFHDLRAARLIETYEEVTGQPAPVRGQPVDRELDRVGRQQVAREAGHGEHRTGVAYVGGRKRQ